MNTHQTTKLFAATAISVSALAQTQDQLACPTNLAEIQTTLGSGFRLHETEHFSIFYDTPYETLRPLTARLEGIYDAIDRFCATLDFRVKPLSSRLIIVIFARYEDFLAFAKKAGLGEGVAGFYNPRNNIAAFVNVLDSPALRPLQHELVRLDAMLQESGGPFAVRQQRDEVAGRVMALRAQRDSLVETFNRLVLQHEAAHQVFFNLGVHVRGAKTPLWLVEGLACQFEVPQADGNGALKRVNHVRLGDFREALEAGKNAFEPKAMLKRAVEAGRLLGLRELLAADQFDGDSRKMTFKYAQSWALVHYLHRERPRAFEKYLARIAARKPGMEVPPEDEIRDFEAAFGAADENLESLWLNFMLRLRYDASARS